jgi:hypothetical protein
MQKSRREFASFGDGFTGIQNMVLGTGEVCELGYTNR